MSEPTRHGLRPVLGAACRAALREAIPVVAADWSAETSAHVDACPDCAARVRASGRLAAWVAGAPRPTMPAALTGRAGELLERIHERVVERAESGPLGAWLGAADVAMPEASEEMAASTGWAEAVVGERAGLASRVISEPSSPGAAVWSQVRRSILDTVAQAGGAQSGAAQAGAAQAGGAQAADAPLEAGSRPAAALRSAGFLWRILFAGAAASVAIGFLAVSSGGFATGGNTHGEQTEFVLVDLGRAPDMDFAVARYGLRR